jgi:two-component system, NtrC family, response regulator GlrR
LTLAEAVGLRLSSDSLFATFLGVFWPQNILKARSSAGARCVLPKGNMERITSTVLASAANAARAREISAMLDRIGEPCSVCLWNEAMTAVSGTVVLICDSNEFGAAIGAVSAWIAAGQCTILSAGCGLDGDQQAALLAAGVVDFITLPCDAGELKARVLRASGALAHAAATASSRSRIQNIIGTSPPFQRCMAQLEMIAGCEASVLIHGETGTGKEVCAQAIHYGSARASHPWVAVNCGAIARDLLESELFGHVRGAFTTAHAARAGLVREAESGTLFLDDIDCLPLDAQSKLLRFLQEREYRQVGSNTVLHANVRVIAASNQGLRELAAQGRFRQDLYFRLNVLNLKLPPLRERSADIVPLALHFLRQFAREFGRATHALTPEAMHKLLLYSWPGNVRELKHVIERAVLLSREPILRGEDIELEDEMEQGANPQSFRAAKAKVVQDFERTYIEQLLVVSGGNITSAASAAKKNRRAFWELIRKYEIEPERFRPQS